MVCPEPTASLLILQWIFTFGQAVFWICYWELVKFLWRLTFNRDSDTTDE